MRTLLALSSRPYRLQLLSALKHGGVGRMKSQYRTGLNRLAAYGAARPGEIAELITFRQTGYGITLEHVQMVFASGWIRKIAPSVIHDIGSHRAWLLGIGAHYSVVSLDVREPPIKLDNETFNGGRAEALPWGDQSVNFLTSLHSIEHFGLGAYGDEFDAFGDHKAAKEIARVIRPGGTLILTTTITGGDTYTVFDAYRVYGLAELRQLFENFDILEERIFSRQLRKFVAPEQLVRQVKPHVSDLYLLAARRKA